MKKLPIRLREMMEVVGLMFVLWLVGGLLGALKNTFPHKFPVALAGIAAMLLVWAYILDHILRNLGEVKPTFFKYLIFYFLLAVVVIIAFGLFLDPWPAPAYFERLPDSMLASAKGFCTLGYDETLKDYSAWSLILPAESLVSFSLIALVFGAVIQQGLPRLAVKPPRKKRKSRKRAKTKVNTQ